MVEVLLYKLGIALWWVKNNLNRYLKVQSIVNIIKKIYTLNLEKSKTFIDFLLIEYRCVFQKHLRF